MRRWRPYLLARERDALLLCLVNHQLHIRKDAADFLSFGHLIALAPELFGGLADGLDESEFLHVPRRPLLPLGGRQEGLASGGTELTSCYHFPPSMVVRPGSHSFLKTLFTKPVA